MSGSAAPVLCSTAGGHLLQQGPILLAGCSHRQGLLPQLQRLREGVFPPRRPRMLLGHRPPAAAAAQRAGRPRIFLILCLVSGLLLLPLWGWARLGRPGPCRWCLVLLVAGGLKPWVRAGSSSRGRCRRQLAPVGCGSSCLLLQSLLGLPGSSRGGGPRSLLPLGARHRLLSGCTGSPCVAGPWWAHSSCGGGPLLGGSSSRAHAGPPSGGGLLALGAACSRAGRLAPIAGA